MAGQNALRGGQIGLFLIFVFDRTGPESLLPGIGPLEGDQHGGGHFTLAEIIAHGLADFFLPACVIQRVVDDLEGDPEVHPVFGHGLRCGGGLIRHDRSDFAGGGKQRRRLGPYDVDVIIHRRFKVAGGRKLHNLALRDDRGGVRQYAENIERSFLHHELERARKQEIPDQHAGLIAENEIGCVLSAPLALLADAASYLASAALLAGIPEREAEPGAAGGAREGRLARALGGLREIRREAQLRALLAASLALSGAPFGQEAIFVLSMVVICTMLVVVTYDVSTETAAGRRRLRRVARVCESTGQRVQKSVFECQVNEMQLEQLERALLAEIDETADNLRFYRITESAHLRVKQYGVFRAVDFEGPLVL